MESDRTRVLRIARNAELVHPDLPLVEAFLNDAVDGERAAKYLLQTYADCSDVNFTRFVKDWRDLVNLCKFQPKNEVSTSLNTKVYVETPYSRYLSWAQKKQVARRDDYRCCLTGEQCRFWNLWDVFPIIPPTALCIREVRQLTLRVCFGRISDFICSTGCMRCLAPLPRPFTEICSKTKLWRIKVVIDGR